MAFANIKKIIYVFIFYRKRNLLQRHKRDKAYRTGESAALAPSRECAICNVQCAINFVKNRFAIFVIITTTPPRLILLLRNKIRGTPSLKRRGL
jgi:hypothetical protein